MVLYKFNKVLDFLSYICIILIYPRLTPIPREITFVGVVWISRLSLLSLLDTKVLAMKFKVLIILFCFFLSSFQSDKKKEAFINRLAASQKNGGFEMEDYWVWGASVIKGEDGKYHMFASRWPKDKPFFNGYILCKQWCFWGKCSKSDIYKK